MRGRLYGLLVLLGDRLPGDQTSLLHYFVEVGEYDALPSRRGGTR